MEFEAEEQGPDAITLQFRNAGYQMVNKLHSFGLEVKSNFGDSYANKFRAVYTFFRDHRNPFSTPFPALTISQYNVPYIIVGHEPFSINNVLNQDALQLTDNFNIILAKHTLTVGASYEQFKFGNSFNLTGYGFAVFGSTDIDTFYKYAPAGSLGADVTYAKSQAAAGKWTWYYLTVGQLAGYIQDEWKASENLRVTYGLRMDIPKYMNSKYQQPDGTTSSPTLQNNDDLTLFDEHGQDVRTVVDNYFGMEVERCAHMSIVGFSRFALNRIYRYSPVGYQRRSHVVLCGEGVRRAQRDVRPARLQRDGEVRGFRGHMEARREALPRERALAREPLPQLPQHGHGALGPFGAPAPFRGETQIFDVVCRAVRGRGHRAAVRDS